MSRHKGSLLATVSIPDRWLQGFCLGWLRDNPGRTFKESLQAAVDQWLEQAELERQWEAEHGR